jgi:hypothetical protein
LLRTTNDLGMYSCTASLRLRKRLRAFLMGRNYRP